MTGTYPVWGWAQDPGDAPTEQTLRDLVPLARDHLGLAVTEPETPAALPVLSPDRVSRRMPASLAGLASADPVDRARHSLGRSYRDIVRGIRQYLTAHHSQMVRLKELVDIIES